MTWTKRPLGEVASIDRSAAPPEAIGDGTLYVGLENMTSDGTFVDVREVDNGELASTKFRFNEKHVLYGKLRPYLRKTTRPNFDGVCSTDILPISAGSNLNRDFLYHFLRLPETVNLATTRSAGANLPRISPRVLEEFEIPLPPLDEQKRIAEVLDKADALRQKRRLALQKLDSLLQSVFIDMFGDPVTNPKGWNVENLGDVSRLVSGNSLPEGEEFIEQKDGLFLLKVSDMNSKGNEELITVANLWAAGYGNANVICPKDSIIIPKRGGAIFTNKKRMLTRPAVLDPNLMAIIPDERIIDPQFLFQWFKGFDLGSLTSGSSVPQLNKQDLYPLRIAIPPFEKQEEFRKVASIIKVAEQKQKASNVHLDQLFNSLQQRAFSGHIFT